MGEGGQLYLVSDFRVRKAVVSNKDVEKFGIPHFMHSHTMFLSDDFFRMLYIVEDMP